MYNYRIHESTISLFVPVVCRAIYEELKSEYLKVRMLFINFNIALELIYNTYVPNILTFNIITNTF